MTSVSSDIHAQYLHACEELASATKKLDDLSPKALQDARRAARNSVAAWQHVKVELEKRYRFGSHAG